MREIRGESAWGALAADGGVAVVASDDATLPDTPRRGSGAAAVTQPVCLRTLQAGAAALCVSIDSPQGLVGAAAADGTVRLWHSLWAGARTRSPRTAAARARSTSTARWCSRAAAAARSTCGRRRAAPRRRRSPATPTPSRRCRPDRAAPSRARPTARFWQWDSPRANRSSRSARRAFRGRPGHAGGRRRHAAADRLEHGRPRRRVGRRRRPRRGGDVPAVLELGLASGSSDSTVKMWDLRTGACHRTLSGHVRRRAVRRNSRRNSLAQFSDAPPVPPAAGVRGAHGALLRPPAAHGLDRRHRPRVGPSHWRLRAHAARRRRRQLAALRRPARLRRHQHPRRRRPLRRRRRPPRLLQPDGRAPRRPRRRRRVGALGRPRRQPPRLRQRRRDGAAVERGARARARAVVRRRRRPRARRRARERARVGEGISG